MCIKPIQRKYEMSVSVILHWSINTIVVDEEKTVDRIDVRFGLVFPLSCPNAI